MKVLLEKKVLEQGILTCAKAISARSPLPILSHVLIKAEDDALTLIGTDLELGITCHIPAQVLKAGSITAPARVLSEIVTQLPDSDVALEVKDKGVTLELRADQSQYTLNTLPAEDFPLIPQASTYPTLALEQQLLKGMIQRVIFAAASPEETRAILTGVLLFLKGKEATLVATDGRRLAKMVAPLSEKMSADKKVVIPARALAEVGRLLKDTQDPVDIVVGDGQIFFQLGKVVVMSRLLDGAFPNFETVIPKSFQHTATVDTSKLLSALKRALILAQEKDSPKLVKLQFQSKTLVITANTQDLGRAYEEIPETLDGEEMQIAFNGKYVMDVLATVNTAQIHFYLTHPTSPAMIQPVDDTKVTYVVMPVRMREDAAVPVGA